MQPGITRAVPAGVLGFLLGMAIVAVLRALQGLEPVWDIGPSLVVSAFLSAGFFVWGMGAFDPKMSEHGEHPAAGAEDEADEADPPLMVVTHYVFQASFWLIVVLLIIAFFAFVTSDLARVTVDTPEGSALNVAVVTINIFGTSLEMAQSALFVGFIVFTVLSLIVVGGVLALLVYFVSRGVRESEGAPSLEARTPPVPIQKALGDGLGLVIRFLGWLPRLLQRN